MKDKNEYKIRMHIYDIMVQHILEPAVFYMGDDCVIGRFTTASEVDNEGIVRQTDAKVIIAMVREKTWGDALKKVIEQFRKTDTALANKLNFYMEANIL